MKRIITIGLLTIAACAVASTNKSVESQLSAAVEFTKEELEVQLLIEQNKLIIAQFEEFVNKESVLMMEFFSAQIGKPTFFKPISYIVTNDNAIGVAICEIYVAGHMDGYMYVIAGRDGTGWKLLTLISKKLEKQTPSGDT
jgi:hypothetical protein